MALQKAIKQYNGITLSYHRIKDITNIVNQGTKINIVSYVDVDERQKELNQPKYSPNRQEIYTVNSQESVDYNDTLTIENAYNYLKTLDKYNGSIDA